MEKLICTKLGMLTFLRMGRDFRKGKNSEKIVLNSCPGDAVSCSLETKHDRRKAAKVKLFVSERRLQEQSSQSQQTVLGLIPDHVFCCSETNHDRRMVPRPKLFVSLRDYRNKGHNPENLT
jgi:hypothetical protein